MGTLRLTQEIPRGYGSEVRELFGRLKQAGCFWARSNGTGHWKIYHGGRWVGTVGKDTGDIHNLRNFRSNLRRNGVVLR